MAGETVIKVTFVVLFLLYAYFMIGGYTPCRERFQEGVAMIDNRVGICSRQDMFNMPNGYIQHPYVNTPPYNPYPNDSFDGSRTIYQMGPYLNF